MPVETAVTPEADFAVSEKVRDLIGSAKKQQQQETTSRTVIFLDWDDTLLCSTVLSELGLKLNSDLSGHDELKAQLELLSSRILSFLATCCTLGDVVIVTNGQTGWVELSAEKFVPRVLPFLERIPIISARSTFEERFPKQPVAWKYYAFEAALMEYYSSPCSRNILSFGDSNSEREAIQALALDLPDTRCKSIKLMDRPTLGQLDRQLELLIDSVPRLVSHIENLDLRLSPMSEAEAAAAAGSTSLSA